MRLDGKIRIAGLRLSGPRAFLLGLLLAACWANAQSLVVQPGTLFFRNPSGIALTQNVTVSASDGSSPGALSAAVTYPFLGQFWMSVSSSGNTVVVRVLTGNLAAGVYTGNVTVSSPNFSSTTIRVVLTLIPVSGGLPSSALILTPNTLNFQAPQNAPAVTLPPVSLYNPATEAYSWSATANVPWVSITPSSGNGDSPLQVTASGNGLAPGIHLGLISVISSTASTSQIAVTITVQAAQNATLAIQPAVLSLAAVTSGSSQAGLLNVYNTGTGLLSWTAQKSASWLTITPASGSSTTSSQIAGQIVVAASPTGLAAGLYSGTVTITAGNSRVVVPVYLRIGLTSPPSVSPLELVFTVNQNSATPQSSTVTITGTSGTAFKVAASTAGGGNWLTTTPISGTISSSGSTITANLNSSVANSLAAGVYSGEIAISSTATTQQSNIVRVVLRVIPSIQLPYLQVDQGGLAFALEPGQGIAPNGTVNLSVAGGFSAGAAVQAFATTASGGNWLTLNPNVGTVTPSKPLQLSIAASALGLPQGVYAGRIVITAGPTMTPLAVLATMVVGNGLKPGGVAAGSLAAIFTNPADGFISQQDLTNPVSVTLLDSAGDPVPGATVTVRSSNGEPNLVLTDQGGGVYSALFQALSAGPLNLSASAVYSGRNGIQTAPTVAVTGQVGPAQSALPIIYPGGLVNSASYAASPTPLSPGALVSVFGLGIAGAGGSAPGGSDLPTTLGGVSVTVGGIAAPLLAAVPSPNGDQVNLQMPFELDGQLSADVIFNVNGVLSPVQNVPIGVVPAAFTTSQSGTGTAVLHTTDYTPVTPDNPAVAGEVLAIFANSLGPLTTPIADGALATTPDSTTGGVTVTIGGQSAAVQYAGLAPGFAGLYQINVVMPAVPSGANALIIAVNGTPSSGAATIPAQ